MADTQECPKCGATIGKTETTCPACKVNIEEFFDAVTTVEEAQAYIEKKKKKDVPAPAPVTTKKRKLLSLGSAIRRK